MNGRTNPVVEKSFAFAVQAVEFCTGPAGSGLGCLRDQFLDAATSIGANVEESQAAESRADFAHKLAVAGKEAREAHYWLRLFQATRLAPTPSLAPLLSLSAELLRLLSSIVRSARAPLQPRSPIPNS